ncbi:MAG: MFS transporter, partial [Bradyrhizobium sp.]|nr:MFS transporter [Bradyrhizobium sp.]
IAWYFIFRENPADHPGLTQEERALLPPPKPAGQPVPWGPLVRRMAPVTIVYFCYGWTLWLFLSWIPQYFQHQGQDLKNMALFSSGVFLAGVVGDTLGGIVTDRIYVATSNLNRARSLMVSVCMGLTCLSLLPMMFSHDLVLSAISLSAGFFFAEMTIGPMWAVPMDIAPQHSGTASGIMNTGSALAAIISPVVGGFLIDQTGNWQLPFLGSIVLMVVGMALAFTMRPAQRLQQAS